MALIVGSTSNSGTSALYNTSTGGSWSHTTLSGEDSLWVHVGVYNAQVSGITFNGELLTSATSYQVGVYRSYWFYRVNPDIGTYNITVTYDGATTGYGAGGAIAFSGTDTADPMGANAGNVFSGPGYNNNPNQTFNSTVDNSYILQGAIGSGEGADTSVTPGANETEIYEVMTANKQIHQSSYKATTDPGSVTMSETLSQAVTVWVIAIVEVNPLAGTNMKINIGDTFKEVSSAQINIGDSWKPVTKAQVNIGDSWKSIF